MKPLKLNRTTVRSLSDSELSGAAGGTILTRPPISELRLCGGTLIVACNPSWVDRCPSMICTSGGGGLPDPIP